MARTLFHLTLLFSLATGALGCGEPQIGDDGVIVRGKVVKGGEPLQVERRDIGLGSVEVHFIPADDTMEPLVTTAAEDGSFELVGAGQGIEPGSYKVAVYQNVQGPGSDALKGKFSTENTAINIEVPSDKVGEELDMGTIELDDHR